MARHAAIFLVVLRWPHWWEVEHYWHMTRFTETIDE